MESRNFIKQAKVLSERIRAYEPGDDGVTERVDLLQKDITQLFQGLQNPSLPSASKLAKLAIERGFVVEKKVQHHIEQAESFWS